MKVLAIDTSNYMTSVAVVDDQGRICADLRIPIPVPVGERGLRQSEAFFYHSKHLPGLLEQAFTKIDADLGGIVASVAPRNQEGSYMPVFLSGSGTARSICAAVGLPLVARSHQEGHLCAALASSALVPIPDEFLAVHLSGGTSELLVVRWHIANSSRPGIELLGGTSDLNAGQFIDRVGVLLNLPFPAGPHLEKLAMHAKGTVRLSTSVNNLNPSFSGPAAQAERLIAQGVEPAEIAMAVQNAVVKVLEKWLHQAFVSTGIARVLISGGVSANQYIRQHLRDRLAKRGEGISVYFGETKLSGDNAVGLGLSFWYPLIPRAHYGDGE